MSLQNRGQLLNICLFRSISELIRMLRKHWWNFYLHQRIFLFLNRFNGLYEYMIIQIIYKQLLLLGMNMTQGLMPTWNTEYTKYIYSWWHEQSGKHHLHKNLFRLTWKKSRFLLYPGFYCVVWFHVTKQAMGACSDNIYIWDGATLCDTRLGNHSTIWTDLCFRLLCVHVYKNCAQII
jgi:hypothetical protein